MMMQKMVAKIIECKYENDNVFHLEFLDDKHIMVFNNYKDIIKYAIDNMFMIKGNYVVADYFELTKSNA